MHPSFSGAYQPTDIQFLLRPVTLEMTPVDVKEQLIQSGKAHYSDMLSQEPEPSAQHLSLYQQALNHGVHRLTTEVLSIAKRLVAEYHDTPIILASLVRAGVPLGVMLHRTLRRLGHQSHHYGISIIRDRGIDTKALDYIEAHHGTKGIVFVDGWTGKGAITQQLRISLSGRAGYPQKSRLVVLADPCGVSWLSASDDDWLIPFGILGAPVSGLVSRSVWSEHDYHGCMLCDHLSAFECGTALVDQMSAILNTMNIEAIPPSPWQWETQEHLTTLSQQVVATLQARYSVDKVNRIKPGIAEATRAVLRRVPDHILVRDLTDPDVALLVHLADHKKIKIQEVGDLIGQYRAVTIIKKVL